MICLPGTHDLLWPVFVPPTQIQAEILASKNDGFGKWGLWELIRA